jgi:hypothetical protein
MRRVTNTAASASLAGNHYAVDQALIGRRVELRFDPEDLERVDRGQQARGGEPRGGVCQNQHNLAFADEIFHSDFVNLRPEGRPIPPAARPAAGFQAL